jgi:hypothetical protein
VVGKHRVTLLAVGNETEVSIRTCDESCVEVVGDNGVQYRRTVLKKVKPVPVPFLLWKEQQQFIRGPVRQIAFTKKKRKRALSFQGETAEDNADVDGTVDRRSLRLSEEEEWQSKVRRFKCLE